MINDEKLKDKFADILMGAQKQGGFRNKTLEMLIDAVYEAISKQRTSSQNNALHKDCELIAEKLNNSGYSLIEVIKILFLSIPFTTLWVKDNLWRRIQKRMFGKTSTTELEKSSNEINQIHDVLMRELGEKLGIEYHPFPHDPKKQKEWEDNLIGKDMDYPGPAKEITAF